MANTKSDHKSWVITTDRQRPMHEIAAELAAAELADGQVLDELGIVVGRATEAAAAKLRAVPGVVDVSPDEPVDVGPPGSGDTW
jgi:hypothetical protein